MLARAELARKQELAKAAPSSGSWRQGKEPPKPEPEKKDTWRLSEYTIHNF